MKSSLKTLENHKKQFITLSIDSFNVLVLIVGLFLIVAAGLFLSVFRHDYSFTRFSVTTVSLFLIVIGCLIIILAGIGIATWSIGHMISFGFYIVGLLFVFFFLTILGTWGFIVNLNGSLKEKAFNVMNTSLHAYNETDYTLLQTKQIDWIQLKFRCCGVESFADWQQSKIVNSVAKPALTYSFLLHQRQIPFDVPDTCCITVTPNCGKNFRSNETINTRGCFTDYNQMLHQDINIICIVCIGLSIIIALCIVFFITMVSISDYETVGNKSFDDSEVSSSSTSSEMSPNRYRNK
jgi:hypothetical protein